MNTEHHINRVNLKDKGLGWYDQIALFNPPNPLKIVFYSSIIFAIFTLFNLLTGGGILVRKYGELTGYSQQVTTYTYGDDNNPDKPTSVSRLVPDPNSPDYPDDPINAVTTTMFDNYEDDDGPMVNRVAYETVIDPVNNATVTHYDRQGLLLDVMQGTYDPNNARVAELTTSRTYYTNNRLPYLTGITSGEPNDLTWHTLSLTFYDGQNRVLKSMQVDIKDAGELASVFTGDPAFGVVKSHDDLAVLDDETWSHIVSKYRYFEAPITEVQSPDQPEWIEDASDNRQYFYYNANNQQVASWSVWDDPNTAAVETVRILNISETDAQGRAVRSVRIVDDAAETVGNILADVDDYINTDTGVSEAVVQSQMVYNEIGKVDYAVDPYNVVTKYEYDEVGQLVETLVYESFAAFETYYPHYPADANGILTISRTLYDAEGRSIVSVGPYAPADTAHASVGTEMVYDALGRVVETRRWPDVQIVLEDFYAADGVTVVGRRIPQDKLAANAWADANALNEASTMLAWTSSGAQPVVGSELSYSQTDYDPAGRVWRNWTQNDDGDLVCTAEYIYDPAGRQTKTITLPDDPENRTETVTIYDGSRRSAVIDARNNTTSFIYDDLGRIIMTDLPEVLIEGQTAPVSLYVHTRYDSFGRKQWQSEPVLTSVAENVDNDQKKYYEYNSLGQLEAVVLEPVADPENSDTTTWPRYVYTYDDYGNLQTISDKVCQWASPFDPSFDPDTDLDGSVSHQTTFGYDYHNQQTSRTLPNDKTEYTSYDELGRVETQEDFNGHYCVYEYDTRGRLAYKRYYANAAAYDADHPTYNAAPEIAYGYDNLNRLIIQTVTEYNAAGQVIGTPQIWETFYDNESRITRLESPQGIVNYDYSPVTGRKWRLWTGDTFETVDNIVEYGYDNLGRMETVTVKKRNGLTVDETTTYTYDPVGSIESITYPNGNYTYHWYNAVNWLIKLTNFAQYETDPDNPTGGIFSSFEYSYYADGMRASATETLDGVSYTTSWEYDNLNRLSEEDWGGGLIDRYEYDLVGNRLAMKDGQEQPLVSYTYNMLDQLETEDYTNPTATDYSYTYDENGSLTRRYHGLDQQTAPYDEYGYNLQSRMTSFIPSGGSTVAYGYNPDGIRVSKSVSGSAIDYLIDPYNPTGYSQVLVADDGTNKTFYPHGNDVTGQAVNTGNPVYMLYDGHASVRQLADANGNLISGQQFEYDAYGNLANTVTPQTEYLYAGEQFDTHLQWYNNRDRYSIPSLGRFNQMDRFPGYQGNPKSLHKYLYCYSNPVNNTDPTGLLYKYLLYGQIVHREIGADFVSKGIDAMSDRTINTILDTKLSWWGLNKPDLVERATGEVYEIKPVGSYLLGYAQLGWYLTLLNTNDPWHRPWRPGTSYIPPKKIIIGPITHAIVNPPIGGVILYEVIDLKPAVAAVAIYYSYDIYQRVSTAMTLQTLAPSY